MHEHGGDVDGYRAHLVAGVYSDEANGSDCSTVYALAIVFDLLPNELRTRAGARLAELAAANGYRVATGFAGTPFVLDALSSTGQLEAAYRLLLERECPSWLYPVTMGATTVWERWDSMLPDGSINLGQMTSFNHYAFGAVADWMHRVGAIACAGRRGVGRGTAHPLRVTLPGHTLSSTGSISASAAQWRSGCGVDQSGPDRVVLPE